MLASVPKCCYKGFVIAILDCDDLLVKIAQDRNSVCLLTIVSSLATFGFDTHFFFFICVLTDFTTKRIIFRLVFQQNCIQPPAYEKTSSTATVVGLSTRGRTKGREWRQFVRMRTYDAKRCVTTERERESLLSRNIYIVILLWGQEPVPSHCVSIYL